jgi:hypothetical protein
MSMNLSASLLCKMVLAKFVRFACHSLKTYLKFFSLAVKALAASVWNVGNLQPWFKTYVKSS